MNNIPLYFDDDQINDYSGSFKKGWKKLVKVLVYRERHPDVNQMNWLNQYRIEKAIDYFNKCVLAYPRSWSSMWGLGKAYQAMGDHSRALEWFEKTYLLKPDLVDVPLEASTEAMRIGNASKALRYAEVALSLDRHNPDFRANLALALYLNHKSDAALEEARNGLKLAPNNNQIQKVLFYLEKLNNKSASIPVTIDPVRIYRGQI
ncbi:MAG: tetratricopeptide repeat protein [Bacteroidota bacterium]